ncbi:MAG: acyltransferase [Butyrivibrio sp.]|nr:acyltransferase [Butyrivibrio sp.]
MDQATGLKQKRNASIELLRIIAMLMIVALHYNYYTRALLGAKEPVNRISPSAGIQIFATIVESFCVTGVNVYVFITGYYLSKAKVKLSKVFRLICQVYFYTFLVSLVMMSVGTSVVKEDDSIFKTVQYLFPISSEHYWFVTAYVIMYVLAPVMNAAVRTLSRKQLKAVITGLLIWFCFVKSIVPVLFVTDKMGYDFGWFVCVYLIAAYVREYDVVLFHTAKKSALVYLISCLMIAATSISFYYISVKLNKFNYYASVPFHYNYIFTLTGSLGLFSLFRFYRMKENVFADVVRVAGPLTLGVYLLHMHVEIKDEWLIWLEGIVGEVPLESVPMFALHMILCILMIFGAGIFVDWIRKMIFDFFGRVLHDTKLFKAIRRWDEELC